MHWQVGSLPLVPPGKLEGNNSRITEAEEWISDLEDRMVKITFSKQNIKKKELKKNKDSLRDLWNNIKHTNIHIIGVSEGEEKGSEKIFEEIIAENFSNMEKEVINKVQETQRVPGRINPRRNTPSHIVIKMTKIKDRDKTLKATREK